jgi:phage FluMu protein Com
VACGRAPELKSVRFEDEQPVQSQNATSRTVEIKCRKCRSVPQLKIQTHTPERPKKNRNFQIY